MPYVLPEAYGSSELVRISPSYSAALVTQSARKFLVRIATVFEQFGSNPKYYRLGVR